jgi:hypothetical protein
VQFADDRHATDDVLERYSMDCLAGPELVEVEEHLLACDPCQDRLAREDSIRRMVRDGGALLQQPHAAVQWRLPWHLPRLASALGLAAASLLVFAGVTQWPSWRRSSAPPTVILLRTLRGAENAPLAAAPGKPLILVLDLSDIQQFPVYSLEIVDAGGHPAFQSKASPRNDSLRITLTRGLPAGTYFVRVYTSAAELLREYALIVRG